MAKGFVLTISLLQYLIHIWMLPVSYDENSTHQCQGVRHRRAGDNLAHCLSVLSLNPLGLKVSLLIQIPIGREREGEEKKKEKGEKRKKTKHSPRESSSQS